MTSSKRALTALATGALALPFLAVPAAYAVAPEPPAEQSIAALCANVAASYNPFTDDEPNTFTAAIECVAFAGIAQGGPNGLPSTQYGPGLSVRRDQMASFIARTIDTADQLDTGNNIKTLPAYDNSNAFTDVASGNTHLQAINRLEAAGIVEGGPGGRPSSQYGPELPVTRAQMASFINRAVAFMQGGDPANAGRTSGYVSNNDYFTDDESFPAHEANINGIASEGIAVGDGRDAYRPGLAIQRDQMAAFLARTLGTLQEAGDIGPIGSRFSVTPDNTVQLPATANPSGSTGDGSTADNREYTATGLDNTKTYRITLVRSENVRRESNGTVTFKGEADSGSSTGFSAVTGMPTADITRTNGSAVPDADGNADGQQSGTTTVVPADGRITFTVDGDSPGESVIPVVYVNGGPGQSAENGGTSPRLEVRSQSAGQFGAPIEAFDIGGQIDFGGAGAVATEAPDLVNVSFVRRTGSAGSEITTVKYTFDEPIVAAVAEGAFHLYRFDGTRIDARDTAADPDTNPDDASAVRDPEDEGSVLVLYTLDEAGFAAVTTATVDAGAVQDSDGKGNPIADRPLNSGTQAAGVTAAPDLLRVTVGGATAAPTGTVTTEVTFAFDENAFVVDRDGFRVVLPSGTEQTCTAAANGATMNDPSDFAGDGTTSIITTCTSSFTTVVRGAVIDNTVSDVDPALQTGDPSGTSGNRNPLQATATPDGLSDGPDLVSVSLDDATSTVTYTFDEDVTLVPPPSTDPRATTGSRFGVYTAAGSPTRAGNTATQESTADRTIVVKFDALDPQTVVGANVRQDAVRDVNNTPAVTNGDDEVPVTPPAFVGGRTAGPDLVSVSRTISTTRDPVSGESSPTGAVVTFLFDEEVASLEQQQQVSGFRFFVVTPDGASTRLTNCAIGDAATSQNGERTVRCTTPATDNPQTPQTNEATVFTAVEDAVAGTVDDNAVLDREMQRNPEGQEPIA